MKKHPILTAFIMGTAALAGYNYFIEQSTDSNRSISNKGYHSFKWRGLDIAYIKKGHGKPLLLIHDLDIYSSSDEWTDVINDLSNDYTVYALDLLGCGRSSHPVSNYTVYEYQKIIRDFIVEVIHKPTNIAASHNAAQIALALGRLHPEYIMQILLINPTLPIEVKDKVTSWKKYLFGKLLLLPIYGTAWFHYKHRKSAVDAELESRYYSPVPSKVKRSANYFIRHNFGAARYLEQSLELGYLDSNIDVSRETFDVPVNLLFAKAYDRNHMYSSYYEKTFSDADTYYVHHSILYPQVEQPSRVSGIIREVF